MRFISTTSRLFPLLYGAVLLLALLVLQLHLFLGILFVFSSGALLFGALLLLPLLVICRRPRLRTYLWVTAIALGLSVLLPFVVANWQAAVSRRRATALIQALEQYRTRQGHYPDSLAQLVPKDLPTTPHTAYALGQYPFYYQPSEEQPAQGYALWYDEGLMVQSFYHGPAGTWHSDD